MRGMTRDLDAAVHDLDVTVWVGKGGIDSVVEELSDQLDDRDAVKVRFLDAAAGGDDVTELAAELAEAADAEVHDVRGNTAVMFR